MSPATALAFHGKTHSATDTSSASSSLWSRMDQINKQDADKTDFLKVSDVISPSLAPSN